MAQLSAINVGAHNPTKIPQRSACASARAERIATSAIASNCDPAIFGDIHQSAIERGIEMSPRARHTFERSIDDSG